MTEWIMVPDPRPERVQGLVSSSLWAAAAVRETFKPDELLVDWLEGHADATKEDRREAFSTVVQLQDAGVEGQSTKGEPALRLPGHIKSTVLGRLGVEGVLAELSRLPIDSRTLTERTLAALLSRQTVNLDMDDGLMLRALKVATEWATAAGANVLSDTDALEKRLERNEFLQQLGGSDLFRFVGRSGIRKKLTSAWITVRDVDWFYIEGPGGVGKSLTVARFIADLLGTEDEPDAIFHLDYDRTQLQLAREVTILQELLKQSARWCEPSGLEELRSMSLELAARGKDLEQAHLSSRSSETYGLERITRELPRLWRQRPNSTAQGPNPRRRVIVFLDSFEQVEYFDEAAAMSARRLLTRFKNVDALVICVSRGFRPETVRTSKPLRLAQFSAVEANAYLRTEAARAGLTVGSSELKEIRETVGRSPLALRLAVSLLEQSHVAVEREAWASLTRSSPELIQAALYDRLLRRIRDPELRKLAMPGLLLRRLTAEVIVQVLAEPCGLSINLQGAAALIASARREGQLFLADPADPGALWHRQDVRATMLLNIERYVGATMVEAINIAAVTYYEGEEDLPMRTEELYHRLRLDQDPTILERRWIAGIDRSLRPVIQELPPRAKAFLRFEMGAAIAYQRPLASRSDAALADIEVKEFRLLATKELQAGSSANYILERWRTEGGGLDTPLADVYAGAFVRAGRHEEFLSLARDFMLSTTAKVPPEVRSAVLSTSAGLLEGRLALAEAQSHWIHALAAADRSQDEVKQLEALVGSVRIRRKLTGGSDSRSKELRRGLGIMRSMEQRLYQYRVLSREIVAEFGEAMLLSDEDVKSEFARLIAYLAESSDLLPSISSEPERRSYLANLLLGSLGVSLDTRTLGSIVSRMAFGDAETLERLINVLRDEVDWSLRRAASNPVRIGG